MIKSQERFLVYLQHHKRVNINGGIFLVIKKCRAVIWYHVVKERAIIIHLLCCKWGVCSIISWSKGKYWPDEDSLCPTPGAVSIWEVLHQCWIADEYFSNVHMKVILPQGMIKSPGVSVSRMQLNTSCQTLFFHNRPEQTLFYGCSSPIAHTGCMASVFVRVSCESPNQRWIIVTLVPGWEFK